MAYLFVFLGGGLGSSARHGINMLALRLFGTGFPIGTLFVNVLGSFFMGATVEYFAQKIGVPSHLKLFLTTGILGGFTTFSAFMLEISTLQSRGETAIAIFYIACSVLLGLAALYLGMLAVRQ
jgi:CrcB protein